MQVRTFLARRHATPNRLFIPLTCLVFSFIGVATAQPETLRGRGLSIQIDSATGLLNSVTNILTGETYKTTALPFEISTSDGILAGEHPRMVTPTANGLDVAYEFSSAEVTLHYTLRPDTDFLEKTISFVNKSSSPITLFKITAEQIAFTPRFKEIHPHYDPSQYRWLINLFLRSEKGGFYFGVENPVYESWTKGFTPGSTWVQLDFNANLIVAPGESYVSEPSFLGAFRNEQIYVFKEIRKLFQAVNEPKAIPSALSLTPEILDWGEVWAMQDFIRTIEPPHDNGKPGFYVRVVGEVGGRKTGNPDHDKNVADHVHFGPQYVSGSEQLIDEVAALGHVPHLEWATEWFGVAGYGRNSEHMELENAGPGDPLPVNPYWLEVVKYGWSKGLQASIFETISRNFARNKSDWKVLRRDGKPWTWGKDNSPINCWGNPDFAKWRLQVTDQAIKDYNLYMVAWDAFAPADWSWFGFPVLETACYAPNHGHLPGDTRYAIFRNITQFVGELQRRHPNVAFRVASGLTTDYPWVLKNLIEYHPDFYDGETGASYWTSYNFRFLPMYKSGILLSAKTKNDFEYLLLRSIASSDHFMLWSDAVPVALADREYWQRWLTWADDNIKYLRVGRTLFREPWGDKRVASLPPNLEGRLPYPTAAINGSAHCIKDRGYLFLFNPSAQIRIASVPINNWLGLTQGKHFVVRVLYATNGGNERTYGPYNLGQEMRLPIAAGTAMILQVEPATGNRSFGLPPSSPGAPVDKAFLRWNELPWEDIQTQP
jgi:hypothetical protein